MPHNDAIHGTQLKTNTPKKILNDCYYFSRKVANSATKWSRQDFSTPRKMLAKWIIWDLETKIEFCITHLPAKRRYFSWDKSRGVVPIFTGVLGNLRVQFGGPGSPSWRFRLYTVRTAQMADADAAAGCAARTWVWCEAIRGVLNAKRFAAPFEASLNDTMVTYSAHLMDSPLDVTQ